LQRYKFISKLFAGIGINNIMPLIFLQKQIKQFLVFINACQTVVCRLIYNYSIGGSKGNVSIFMILKDNMEKYC
jgi:hypothetical protein